MEALPAGDITRLLAATQEGDRAAFEQLWSLIYDELHRMARQQLAGEIPGRRLQPTSLIHEVYLRLAGDQDACWNHRGHFFSAAAQAMRRVRVDYARRGKALKRGGDRHVQPLASEPAFEEQDPAEILAADEALTRFEAEYPDRARVVAMRYFAGLTVEETASALGIATRTVEKHWSFARAWLHRELTRD